MYYTHYKFEGWSKLLLSLYSRSFFFKLVLCLFIEGEVSMMAICLCLCVGRAPLPEL